MASFQYVFIDQKGKQKKGTMEALSKEKVILTLKAEGKIPIKVTEQNIFTKDINVNLTKAVKPRVLGLFCRQFHSILSAGIPIIRALDILSNQTENKVLKKAIRETQINVEKGETLAVAMKLQGTVFPAILINMVESGEATGNLETSFERMSTYFEKDAKLKAMLKKAMIYPSIVSLVAVGVIALMLLMVIPNFMSMFEEMNVDMPAYTMAVINMSNFMLSYWYIILLIIIFLVILIRLYKSTEQGQESFSSIGLKIPLLGKLIIKTASARLGKTLSDLLAAGIPLIEAIDITAKNMDNVLVKNVLMKAKEDITRGIPLSTPLENSGIFPPMVYQMIRIGEETGNMESMLDKIADYYEEEVASASQALLAVLEPLIIVVLALIVGILLLAIIQPMMAIYEGVETLY